jgi:class 3 adenylate cyclase
MIARARAFVRETFERAHPLIRLSYLPRFVALTFAAPALAQFENRAWTSFDTAYFTTALLAPHLWFFGSALFWNTRTAGRVAMLSDAVINGVVVALYGGTTALTVPFVVVTLSNAISVGGVAFMLQAGASMAVTAHVTRWALPANFTAGRLSAAGELGTFLFLAFYMCLSAFSMRSQARRINRMRQQLEGTNELLEARVQERTAALASTNAAISRFVPLEFLSALGHADVTTAKLGDVSAREVTVLFADIRNFTAMSERLSPEATFRFLNECLSRMGPHIRAQSGFVDKYIGDAIMALFPRSPADAVRAALAMQAELRAYNQAHPSEAPLAIGVGIHVGQVMMGTIGEAQRFEATVISDAVNLTARLETLTKQLGCTILVSDAVAAHLSDDERSCTRPLGTFAVKGKSEPVAIVEIFASDDVALREAKRASIPSLARALAHYTQDELVEALTVVGELAEACPEDGPLNWWLQRMQRELAEDGPPSGHRIVRLDEK